MKGRRGGNLVPECSFTCICARACENELPGEVIHCSAETNACGRARAHACVYDARRAALSSEIRLRVEREENNRDVRTGDREGGKRDRDAYTLRARARARASLGALVVA